VDRKYILPCAGYDRPGGHISRAAAEELMKLRDDIIVGSIGALYKERPGEMREFRTSDIICLDGCGTQCASELVQARGRSDACVFSIPEVVGTIESFEEKVKQVVDKISENLEITEEKAAPKTVTAEFATIDYLNEKIDKFTLRVAKFHKYSDNDFWVRIEGPLVRIGVSDLLQQMMSDVYFVELAEQGTHVEMFDDAGVMESTKILVEVIVPVSGTIVNVNKSLEDSPELINESPYERGWLYLIKPDDITELELLKDAPDYLKSAIQKANEEIGKKVI